MAITTVPNASLTNQNLVDSVYALRGPTNTILYGTQEETPTTSVWTGSVTIPQYYLGYHCKFPDGVVMPFAGVGTLRSHDAGIGWYNIETEPAVFSWTRLDAWLAGCKLHNARAIFTLYGTPSFYAASQGADPYGKPGGNQPPTFGTIYVNTLAFVSELLTHVVAWEAANGALPEFVIECWNEPAYTGNFWQGTAAQLAQVARGCLDALSVRAGTKIISPGFTGDITTTMGAFMTASGGGGQTGRTCSVDGAAYHPYESNFEWYLFNGGRFTDARNDPPSSVVASLNTAVPDPDLPIWMTEIGHHNPSNFWNTLTVAERKRYIACVTLEYARLGCQCCCWYDYGGLAGNAFANAEIASMYATLATYQGKTMTKRTVNRAGGAIYEFSDAPTLVV